MKKQLIYVMAILIIILIVPQISFSQPPPPPPPPVDTEIPFDGGLSILLAAGVGYGVKRFRQSHKK